MPMFGDDKATFHDPETNVELNRMPIRRGTVRPGPETETVLKYWRLGHPQHRIAGMLGVHPFAISDILGDKPRPPGSSDLHDGHGDPNQPDLNI